MRLFLFAIAIFSCVESAHADPVIGLVTGPKTGTYYSVGLDIAGVAKAADVPVEVRASEGSIDNIRRINSTENAALGIVQSDALGFLARSEADASQDATHLRVVFPLYNEEVHVLARRSIKSFAELEGKRVAIGEEGSGSMLTALNLFSLMKVNPKESKEMPAEQAVVAVLRAELDAVIFVGGKPVRLFKNLEDLSRPENEKYARMIDHVHFLPLSDAKMLSEYKTAEITSSDYAFVEESVPTVAVQSLLISYDFTQMKGTGQCDLLRSLAKALRSGLGNLRANGHPKWKEVNFDLDAGAWKKDSCAW